MLVGLMPAAGHATRLGRMPCSKEVLRVGGRPVMDHLAERFRAAGVDAIRVVTRPEKHDVVEQARALGADVVLGRPADVAASLQLAVQDLDDADEVLYGFPDTIWDPVDGFARMLPVLRAGWEVVLGLFTTDEPERCDVVVVDGEGRVTGVRVKPPQPPSNRIWGCAATRARVIRRLREGEEPGVAYDRMAAAGQIASVGLGPGWVDIGTPDALLRVDARLP